MLQRHLDLAKFECVLNEIRNVRKSANMDKYSIREILFWFPLARPFVSRRAKTAFFVNGRCLTCFGRLPLPAVLPYLKCRKPKQGFP